MNNLMNRRILKANRRKAGAVNANVEAKTSEQYGYNGNKRKYESITSSPSICKVQTKNQIENNRSPASIIPASSSKFSTSDRLKKIRTNEDLTHYMPLDTSMPKFSANDRLKKYRTVLNDKQNEVLKVHHVLNTSKAQLDECKNQTNLNSSISILGKRKNIERDQSDSDLHKKKCKNNEDNGLVKTLSDKCANKPCMSQRVCENKPFISQQECDMDWSPIDQHEVVTNIQKFRDIYKEKPFLIMDAVRQTAIANIVNTSDNPKKTLYIVVDTNIFISHLNLIQDLLSGSYNGRQPTVYVPWMVVQELDYFKDGLSDSSAMLKASKRAIKFINKNLMEKHTRFQGQTVQQALFQKESSSNADDNILFSCMQLKNTSNEVILLSNDTNLRNKALINNISSYGPKEIEKAIRGSYSDMHDQNQQKVQKISSLLANMCTTIIMVEMESAYGSVLDRLITKPPWDLKQCLVYIKRFWSPVFSLIITQKQCLKQIDDLLKYIQTCKGLSENMEEFVKLCFTLCVYFKNNCNKFQKEVITCINNMHKVLQ